MPATNRPELAEWLRDQQALLRAEEAYAHALSRASLGQATREQIREAEWAVLQETKRAVTGRN